MALCVGGRVQNQKHWLLVLPAAIIGSELIYAPLFLVLKYSDWGILFLEVVSAILFIHWGASMAPKERERTGGILLLIMGCLDIYRWSDIEVLKSEKDWVYFLNLCRYGAALFALWIIGEQEKRNPNQEPIDLKALRDKIYTAVGAIWYLTIVLVAPIVVSRFILKTWFYDFWFYGNEDVGFLVMAALAFGLGFVFHKSTTLFFLKEAKRMAGM